MKTDRKSEYIYSQTEKEELKVLKMQDNDLASLDQKTKCQTEELKKTREQVEIASKKIGISHIPKTKSEYIPNKPLRIPKSEIPSWEELVERANREVPEDVVIEDLLTKDEIKYCEEDVKRINKEFSEITSIFNVRDLVFLNVATALQTARWLILQKIFGDLGSTDSIKREDSKTADTNKKNTSKYCTDKIENWIDEKNGTEYPTYKNIMLGQYKRLDGGYSKFKCPYDAQKNGPLGFDDGGKGDHRANTLGHDPILGWIFGTANLMTCSISLSKKFNFANHRVYYPGGEFGEPYSYIEMFSDMIKSTIEDYKRLVAALFAQALHLRSDALTKKGLPIPIVETFSEEIPGKLHKEQYDSLCLLKDSTTVDMQAGFSILINMMIGLLHKMYYDKEKDGPDIDLYEVRTRKILMISNQLASAGNIVYCIFSEDWKKLDIGGLLVSLYRLFSDIDFTTRIKDQYIQQQTDQSNAKEIAEIDAHFVD